MTNLNLQTVKEFVSKNRVQVAIGLILATVVILIAYDKRKGGKGSSKQGKLKNVADSDKNEWEGKKETDPAVSDTLISYWKRVGKNFSPSQMQNSSVHSSYPWSSAYVTHLVQSAGYNFKGGSAHSVYAVQGKADRKSGAKERYWAFRPSENKKVEIGDILVKNRDGGNYNYDTLKSGAKTHGDVIIAIQDQGGKKVAFYQGGNLSNSVKRGQIDLTSNGMIPSTSPYFLQLKYVV